MRRLHKKSNFCDPLSMILPMAFDKIKTMSFLVIFCVLAAWPMLAIEAAKAPPPVSVNKCCRIGEQLQRNKECSFGGTDRWWPVIFLIVKHAYFTPLGDAPRFFRVNESSRPNCQSPELISGAHNMALFSNGTLYLPDRTSLIESDHFCVDKDMALVCSRQTQSANLQNQPSNRTFVRKCCGEKESYQNEKDKCETHRDENEIIEHKLLGNSTNQLEYRFGFPQCRENDITIIGKFNESKFDESSGNLTLADGTFQQHQYCLEHVNDAGNIKVFTCTEYWPASGKSEQVI